MYSKLPRYFDNGISTRYVQLSLHTTPHCGCYKARSVRLIVVSESLIRYHVSKVGSSTTERGTYPEQEAIRNLSSEQSFERLVFISI